MEAQLATVTQKGQVTLPKKMRDKVSISPNSKVLVSVSDGSVKIEPVGPDISDMAGMFKLPKGALGIVEARKQIERNYKRF